MVLSGEANCVTTSIGWNIGLVQRGQSYWQLPLCIRETIDIHENVHLWRGTITLPGRHRRAALEVEAYSTQLDALINARAKAMREQRMVDAFLLFEYEQTIRRWLSYFERVAGGSTEIFPGDLLDK